MITSRELTFCKSDRPVTIVATQKTRQLFAGSREEPPDIEIVWREMTCNGAPVRPVEKYRKIWDKVWEDGR